METSINNLFHFDNLNSVIHDVDAIAILTPWKEFLNINTSAKIFDGHLFYKKSKIKPFYSIGL